MGTTALITSTTVAHDRAQLCNSPELILPVSRYAGCCTTLVQCIDMISHLSDYSPATALL